MLKRTCWRQEKKKSTFVQKNNSVLFHYLKDKVQLRRIHIVKAEKVHCTMMKASKVSWFIKKCITAKFFQSNTQEIQIQGLSEDNCSPRSSLFLHHFKQVSKGWKNLFGYYTQPWQSLLRFVIWLTNFLTLSLLDSNFQEKKNFILSKYSAAEPGPRPMPMR